MNINGRIATGVRNINQELRNKYHESGKKPNPYDTIIQKWRKRLEVKHNAQYFLLRQKTPPIIENAPKITIRRNKYKGRAPK